MSKLLQSIPQIGKVEWIGIRKKRKATLMEVGEAAISIEEGLVDDHYSKKRGKRQVTLIQAEHLQAVAGMLQQKEAISPFLTRRNIVVSGINLNALKDQQFSIGKEVILEGTGYCHPCSRMEENLGEGGYNALRGHGGITAKVVQGGIIKKTDAVSFIKKIIPLQKVIAILLFLAFFTTDTLLGQGQRFKAGLNFGITAAQIDGDDSANFNKLGLSAGLSAYTILNQKSDLIIEILFSQRGSRTEFSSSNNTPQQIIRLNYIEVPLIYNFKDWYQEDEDYHKMHFQGGLSYGRLFSSSFVDTSIEDLAPFFRENDISWLLGLKFHINENIGFYARYTRSFNLLYKNTDTNPNANSLLSYFLTFGGNYVF